MIQTITARLNHPKAHESYMDCYCFDSAELGLVAEPFVESTTEVIKNALTWASLPPSEQVQLRFTDDCDTALYFKEKDWPIIYLILEKPVDGGHQYEAACLYPEAAEEKYLDELDFSGGPTCWLCPVLLDYFSNAPNYIYCQIIPAASDAEHSGRSGCLIEPVQP